MIFYIDKLSGLVYGRTGLRTWIDHGKGLGEKVRFRVARRALVREGK